MNEREVVVPDAIGVTTNGVFYSVHIEGFADDGTPKSRDPIRLEEPNLETQVREYNAGNQSQIKFTVSKNLFGGPW